jgi:hypothetical protein
MYSIVAGGRENIAFYNYSTVSGGQENYAMGIYSTISGGQGNVGDGMYSTVAGGRSNVARYQSFTGGGQQNISVGSNSVCVGGYRNTASGSHSFIGGGSENIADTGSVICGGYYNRVNGYASSIIGGRYNLIETSYSVIPGGYGNYLTGNYCLVFGLNARDHLINRSVVFNWITATDSGGTVYINTNAIDSDLGLYLPIDSTNHGIAVARGWILHSDSTYKKNITGIKNALSTLHRVRPVSFNTKLSSDLETGFIAQDLLNSLPHTVYITDKAKGRLGVNYMAIIPFNTAAICELDTKYEKEIENLKAENRTLKERLDKLEKLVKQN